MTGKPNQLPTNSLLGWLGRQFGYIKKAVETDVKVPPASKTLYRDCTIDEKPLPGDPNVKLRRTVIDEVIIKETQNAERKTQNRKS